jgi:hypothetical protein
MKKTVLLFAAMLCSLHIARSQSEPNLEIVSDSIKINTNAGGKAYYNNKEIATRDDLSRSATFVIAASNASEKSKQGADYVCTGENDQNTINLALGALPAGGGKIQLTEGDFNFHNTVGDFEKDVMIQGCGRSTVIHRKFVFLPNYVRFDSLFRMHYINYWYFRDFIIDDENIATGGGCNNDILAWNTNEGEPEGACIIDNVHVINGMIHASPDCSTVAFCLAGVNSRITNCTVQGGFSNAMRIEQINRSNVKTHISGCRTNSDIFVNVSEAIVSNNSATDTFHIMSGSKASLTGNIFETLVLQGEHFLATGNICNAIVNWASNSMITNNLIP